MDDDAGEGVEEGLDPPFAKSHHLERLLRKKAAAEAGDVVEMSGLSDEELLAFLSRW